MGDMGGYALFDFANDEGNPKTAAASKHSIRLYTDKFIVRIVFGIIGADSHMGGEAMASNRPIRFHTNVIQNKGIFSVKVF
jgi:hypothetical protein